MPVWGRLRALSTMFAEFHTAVVASTYCNSWAFLDLDPAEPWRSVARASLELFIARSEAPKERYIARIAELYEVDGVIFHDCRTCPNNSNTRHGMPGRITGRLGIPTLVLDGDVNDLRCFSDEQARTNIEGFVEQLTDAREATSARGFALMTYYAGADSGSWTTKAAVIDGESSCVILRRRRLSRIHRMTV
jgi:benzoyl-CoA reductase/2-hydroxyglutaryl-CoA dehydratase subunit BcrC/BadD/HgdB